MPGLLLPLFGVLASPTAATATAELPPPAAPSESTHRRRRAWAGVGLGVASAGFWGATIALRMSVWEAHRNAERTCDERDPNDFGLDCFGASLGAGLGGAFRQGWSYATVVPATALAAGSGYFFGAAARRAPSAVLGGSLLVGGVLTWAIPRTLYLGNGVPDDWRDELRLMDGTFYAGFAAVGLGAALLAAMEGARSANARLQALSFAVDPRGLSVSGRI